MSAIIRNALVGLGALSTTAIGGVAYWVNGKTNHLPADQKGSLLTRMNEVLGSFKRSRQIQHGDTADYHTELVASLSSREFTSRKNAPYPPIHIAEGVRMSPGMSPPIFRYTGNPPVNYPEPPLPTAPNEFVFAGRSPLILDKEVRASILEGEYIRCKSDLQVIDPNATLPLKRVERVDVLITGTTNDEVCRQFRNALLQDFAQLAATEQLAPNQAYSETPVFDCSEEGIETIGDLSNMPEKTKKKIRSGDFTACNYFMIWETRLSLDAKGVGAIAAGSTDGSICEKLWGAYVRNGVVLRHKHK